MSYEPEKPVVENLSGGRTRGRGVVPGLRYVERVVTLPHLGRDAFGKQKFLQQRVCIETVDAAGQLIGESYEWVDVPTEQE